MLKSRRNLLLLVLLAVGVVYLAMPKYIRTPPETKRAIERSALRRSIATALDAYRVDRGSLPPDISYLTTPIAYLNRETAQRLDKIEYGLCVEAERQAWVILIPLLDRGLDNEARFPSPERPLIRFDPTNGPQSVGDLIYTSDEFRSAFKSSDSAPTSGVLKR